MTYKVAASGYVVVEVEAESEAQAFEKVRDETPGVTGELYSLEVHEVVPATEPFKRHTDLS